MYVSAKIIKIINSYFSLRFSSKQSWWGGQFDRYSKTLYCACVLYVTLSRQRAEATTPKSTIFKEFSTLMFSALTKPNLAIFSQIYLKLLRILHDKNEQNWSSGFGEICLVLYFRSDRYSGLDPGPCPSGMGSPGIEPQSLGECVYYTAGSAHFHVTSAWSSKPALLNAKPKN